MSNTKPNTMPEAYDENPAGVEAPSQEDILMNEKDILQGLIEAGREKDSKENYEKIVIQRAGKKYFEFRIRPLSEKEAEACHEHATVYAKRKPGQPKRAIETNGALMRSWLIYTATVDEDREKVWDNRQAQEALNVMTGYEMIDAVLLAGEKDAVIDRINDISGYGDNEIEETAKN